MAMTEGFYIFLISSSFAFLTFIGRMCYKSKCSEIKCFGVKIIRDVDQETEDLITGFLALARDSYAMGLGVSAKTSPS